MNLPLPVALRSDKVTSVELPVKIDAESGASYSYDLSFEALLARRVPADADFSSINWAALPSTPFERNSGGRTTGSFRLGWNAGGLFVEVEVNDSTFVHVEYEKTGQRWNNDCLQLYIDTMANARVRTFKGYDEDDYDYAVFPNAAGDASIVYRYRSVEQQLGLATQAPPEQHGRARHPQLVQQPEWRVDLPGLYPGQISAADEAGGGLVLRAGTLCSKRRPVRQGRLRLDSGQRWQRMLQQATYLASSPAC